MKKPLLILIGSAIILGLGSCAGPGTLKWRYDVGCRVVTAPAIGLDGTLYFQAADDYLYALTPQGQLKWRYQLRIRATSDLAIDADGTIYLLTEGPLYAITPDGKCKWKYHTGVYETTSLAIGSDGTLYFGGWDNYFYAVSSQGELK